MRSRAPGAAMSTLVAAVMLATVGVAQDSAMQMREAMAQFSAHDVRAAASTCRRVLAGEAEGEDFARATLLASKISWRFRRDHEDALTVLDDGIEAGVLLSELHRERSRALLDADRVAEAIESARAAVATADDFGTRQAAAAQWLLSALAGEAGTRDAELRAALDHFLDAGELFQDALGPSRGALRAALLLQDGGAALRAWRSYYASILGREDVGILAGPLRELTQTLPRWSPERAPTDAERQAVAAALAGSALFEETRLVLSGLGGRLPRLEAAPDRELVAYATFVHELEEATNEFYRLTAIGKGGESRYERGVDRLGRGLWKELGLVGRYSRARLFEHVTERFGAQVREGRTSGYRDIHYGHRVVDDVLSIEQYDHAAEFRFVATDGLVSNGFQSWAWDSQAAHGGTVMGETVIQFRPAYAGSPRQTWERLTDPRLREERAEEVRTATEQDVAIAAREPIATFRGMILRMELQGVEAILAGLEAEGHGGEELERRFLARYREAVFESSIVAHEGRHAIDRMLGLSIDSEEREYRAKLSEIAFAPHPRVGLGNILLLEGDYAHARANRRIAKGLAAWMQRHRGEIEGLDAGTPLLPQLDLLTDDQLRAAFASMDPLAR